MTVKELENLKLCQGIILENAFGDKSYWFVDKIDYINEVAGFLITKNKRTGKVKDKDIMTGKKFIEVTIKDDDGHTLYLSQYTPFRLKSCTPDWW